jgi:hypothetical protein
MEFKILKQQEINVLADLFGEKRISIQEIYTINYFKNTERFMLLKREKTLSESVMATLDFIEILIDIFTPVRVMAISPNNKSLISYGDMVHTHVITNTEISEDNNKYEGVLTEKHTKQYYDEIFFLINQSNPDTSLQEKYKEILIKLKRINGFEERFFKFVIPLLELNYIISQIMSISALAHLIANIIDPIYTKLSDELSVYIPQIDPYTIYYISENKRLPATRKGNKLSIKGDKKVDIVRIADFFGLSISEINKIFTPAVDSNDRNKVSKEGIFKVLRKYPTLRKNISTQK